MLQVVAVFERLCDPTADAGQFDRNCRAWAEQILVPRRRAQEGGESGLTKPGADRSNALLERSGTVIQTEQNVGPALLSGLQRRRRVAEDSGPCRGGLAPGEVPDPQEVKAGSRRLPR